MRKKTLSRIVDSVFWLIIALLPVIFFVVQPLAYELTTTAEVLPSFSDVMATFGMDNSNIIYTSLMDIFGTDGILPFFGTSSSAVVLYLSYFVIVQLLHVFIDFVLFIPRLSHKWLGKITNTED